MAPVRSARSDSRLYHHYYITLADTHIIRRCLLVFILNTCANIIVAIEAIYYNNNIYIGILRFFFPPFKFLQSLYHNGCRRDTLTIRLSCFFFFFVWKNLKKHAFTTYAKRRTTRLRNYMIYAHTYYVSATAAAGARVRVMCVFKPRHNFRYTYVHNIHKCRDAGLGSAAFRRPLHRSIEFNCFFFFFGRVISYIGVDTIEQLLGVEWMARKKKKTTNEFVERTNNEIYRTTSDE